MQRTIDETTRAPRKQIAFNMEHNITPRTVTKSKEQVFAQTSVLDIKGYDPNNPHALTADQPPVLLAADEQAEYSTIPQLEKRNR